MVESDIQNNRFSLLRPSHLVREASSMRYVYIIAQTAASVCIIVQAYLRHPQHVRTYNSPGHCRSIWVLADRFQIVSQAAAKHTANLITCRKKKQVSHLARTAKQEQVVVVYSIYMGSIGFCVQGR
jgi:hypothetical protein